jgi:hypothetical protein
MFQGNGMHLFIGLGHWSSTLRVGQGGQIVPDLLNLPGVPDR